MKLPIAWRRQEDLSEEQEPEQDHGLENQQEGTALEIGL